MKFKNSLARIFKRFGSARLLFILAVILVVGPIWWSVNSASEPLKAAGEARVIMDIGQSQRTFEGVVKPPMTLFEALLAASEAGNIPLKYSIDRENRLQLIQVGEYLGAEAKKIRISRNYQRLSIPNLHTIPARPGDIIKITAD